MGTCDDNDTMLQRSDQLLLTPENDYFEGSMQTESMMHSMISDGGGVTSPPVQSRVCTMSCLRLEKHATFKVIVLRRQEELVGPLQHTIIANACPHDSPGKIIAIEQL